MATIWLIGATVLVCFSSITSLQGVFNDYSPSNVKASNVTSRSMTISWQKPKNSSGMITYDVFYKAEGYDWQEKANITETKANLVVKPDRTYEIFVMSKTKDLYGAASPRLKNIKTLQDIPDKCPQIESFESRHDKKSVGIQWSQIAKEDQNGELTGFIIVYRTCNMDKEEKKNVTYEDPTGTFYTLNATYPVAVQVVARNKKGLCKDWEKDAVMISEQYYEDRSKDLICPSTPLPKTTNSATSSITHVTTEQAPITTTTQSQETKESQGTQTPCSTVSPKPCDCPTTKEPDAETEKPAVKLSSVGENDWLKYVAIALGVIVVIMGITIFILIWQLYKNHRFYTLRRDEAYKMRAKNGAHDNEAQENP